MDFNFIVDKKCLLLKMLANRNGYEELENWKKNIVINVLDEKIIKTIEAKKECLEENYIWGNFDQIIKSDDIELKFNLIMKDELFCKYYKENLEYLNLLQNAWLKEKDKINKWLKETIKLNISKEAILVYVSHPYLNMGKCIDQKYIFWGHSKGIKDINYNLVYLCHEALHALLPNQKCIPPAMKLYYDKSNGATNQEQWDLLNSSIENYYKIYDFEFDIIHSVIEFISDNELYTLLSKSSKYDEGHNEIDYSLVKYKELILPYWFQYLGLKEDDINKRIPNFKAKNVEILPEDAKQSIENFINFFENNELIRSKFDVPSLPQVNLKK